MLAPRYLRNPRSSRLLALRHLPRQPLRLTHSNIAFGQPLARLHDLDDVDELLEEHDGEADAGQNPRPEAVHLVSAGQLEGGGAVGAGEELAQQSPVNLSSGLDVIHDRCLQQGRRECRRGEGEKVEGDEEELVGGTADEEEDLVGLTSAKRSLEKVQNIVTHPVRIIEIQDPTPVLVHFLVALIRPTHDKCGIHVDVVTGKVQRDQALEEDCPPREGRRQENEEA